MAINSIVSGLVQHTYYACRDINTLKHYCQWKNYTYTWYNTYLIDSFLFYHQVDQGPTLPDSLHASNNNGSSGQQVSLVQATSPRKNRFTHNHVGTIYMNMNSCSKFIRCDNLVYFNMWFYLRPWLDKESLSSHYLIILFSWHKGMFQVITDCSRHIIHQQYYNQKIE